MEAILYKHITIMQKTTAKTNFKNIPENIMRHEHPEKPLSSFCDGCLHLDTVPVLRVVRFSKLTLLLKTYLSCASGYQLKTAYICKQHVFSCPFISRTPSNAPCMDLVFAATVSEVICVSALQSLEGLDYFIPPPLVHKFFQQLILQGFPEP